MTRLLSLNSLFSIFCYFLLNLIPADITTKSIALFWGLWGMPAYLPHAHAKLTVCRRVWRIHIWWLFAMLFCSHISFLFSPQMVITTREKKIKCAVGDELGDATYSRREHVNFDGGDTPWLWSWIFMRVGICREWDDREHPRNRKYRMCLGEGQRFCHIKCVKQAYCVIFMSTGSGVGGFEFEF